MNHHILLDKLTATIGAWLVGSNQFFANSVESASFPEHLHQTRLSIPEFEAGDQVELEAETLVGRLDPAFWVYRWQGDAFPTLIVHHGNDERPFETGRFGKNSFRKVLMAGQQPFPANLIILRAPFHRQSSGDYAARLGHLANFVAMLAGSVSLVEGLVMALKKRSDRPVLVTGISLGGWVTNLHRTYFNSADLYLPLLAGAALAELFLTSAYRHLAGRPAHENPEKLRQILNFEDAFMQVTEDNVYPLLARYDQYIQYDRQKVCYGQRPIRVLEKGHITAALASDTLREHLLRHVKALARPDAAAPSPGGDF